MSTPVSRVVEPGGLDSPYVHINRNFNKDNLDLDMNCSTMLWWLACMDVKRNEEVKNKLLDSFYKTLKSCKSREDMKDVYMILSQVKACGGYAIEFVDAVTKKIVANNQNNQQNNSMHSYEYDNFIKKYNRIKIQYDESTKNKMLDSNELDIYLSCFTKVKNELNEIYNRIDKKDAINLETEIDSYIKKLKIGQQQFEDVNSVIRNM